MPSFMIPMTLSFWEDMTLTKVLQADFVISHSIYNLFSMKNNKEDITRNAKKAEAQ
jgi:hypothetical protein